MTDVPTVWHSAAAALENFGAAWEDRYPAIVKLWRAHWGELTPFLAFPPEVRQAQRDRAGNTVRSTGPDAPLRQLKCGMCA
jgi:transposase-like protein